MVAGGSMCGKILCVEQDVSVRKSCCGILKHSGYDAAPASPQVAEIVLRSQKFDLIVLSRLSDFDIPETAEGHLRACQRA